MKECLKEIFCDYLEKIVDDHQKAKIKLEDDIDYVLLTRLIDFNIKDKAECKTFFRK